MDNAYKFEDKWTFEKVANQQTLGNAGGSAGARTPDHLIKSQMLYQLSYRPDRRDTQEYQISYKCQLYLLCSQELITPLRELAPGYPRYC